VLSALCCVALLRTVLGVPMYACGCAHCAPCLKPKSRVLNKKPILTGFLVRSTCCKDHITDP